MHNQSQRCNNISLFCSLRAFHISVRLWVFHWSLSDNKSPQVSRRTRLGISAGLNSSVIWTVSILLLISNPLFPFQTLRNRFRCSNYNWCHFHLHTFRLFFIFGRRQGPSIFRFLLSFIFIQCSARIVKFTKR